MYGLPLQVVENVFDLGELDRLQSCIRLWGERLRLEPSWNPRKRSHTFNRPGAANRVIGLFVPGTDTLAMSRGSRCNAGKENQFLGVGAPRALTWLGSKLLR